VIAQDPPPQDKEKKQREEKLDALKKSMKERYTALESLRDDGTVGETSKGLAELRDEKDADRKVDPKEKDSITVGELVAAENKDRKALYALMAVELKVEPEVVARQNALRLLQKADPDHWIQLKSGRWVQRKQIEKKEKEKEKEKEKGK
jgi:uncharacterized protein YdbL (DUF1318 family)